MQAIKHDMSAERLTGCVCNAANDRRKGRACDAASAKTKRGECRKNGEEKEDKEHIWNASNSTTVTTAAARLSRISAYVLNAMDKAVANLQKAKIKIQWYKHPWRNGR